MDISQSVFTIWHKVRFLNEQNKFLFNTSFHQVTYSGFLRCEGKCSSYQQGGMCWNIFILNKFIHVFFNLIDVMMFD